MMATDYKQIVENKRQAMLDALLLSIESNPTRWEKGWIGIDCPYNATTGKNYTGLNALLLDVIAHGKGYSERRWVTFNQAKELGASIKAGEKASDVFYWSRYDKKTKKPFEVETIAGMTAEERDEYIRENVRPVLKFYQVFNAEQCRNFPQNTRKNTMSDEEQAKQNELIETIIKNSSAPISYDGRDRAYYRTDNDSIHLPQISSFKTKIDYYATALHEIAHSTGHPRRLNRDMSGGFGSKNYAVEELRAELASVFMQAELGISLKGAEIVNHGAYLKSWLSAVKEDKNVFYRAVADAGKISDYIKSNYLEKIEEKEDNTKENQVQNATLKAKETAEAKAIEEERAYVVIEWSEHPNFKDNTVMTFAEADKMLEALNAKAMADEGYYKTKLHICCPLGNNESDWYNDCRFDIGSEASGGILQHINDFANTSWVSETDRKEIQNLVKSISAHIYSKAEIAVNDYYRDYMNVQASNPESVYFKRLGDFYEVLGDKANIVADELKLTLTGRDCGLAERVPMCGVPYHAIDMYVDKLRSKYDVMVDLDNETAKLPKYSKENEQVEQSRQAQQVGQVELVLPLESKMKEYGKSTMFRMPKDGEYSGFVFLAPTSKVQVKDDTARIEIPSNFEFTLKNDGRELRLTSEELRTSLDGKEIGKSAQRTAPSKRNVSRLEALKNNVPGEMQAIPNWCVFRTKWNDEKGKKDKFVLSVHDGKWAKINDRNTWTDFETAYKYALENNCEGLSFALDGSGITCIDLDKCIAKDGELNDVAKKLVSELSDTYSERSASGNGLHFFLKDDILSKDTFANRAELPSGGEIEVYETARFISMTGDLFNKSKQSDKSDKSGKLSKCPMQTMSWIRTALGPKNRIQTAQRSVERQSTDMRYQSDSEVLERIRRSKKAEQFDTLYNGGDVTGDKSRDDLIMLNTLAFFTDCNEEQMRTIFEGSARFRPETKSSAYVTRSIRKACDSLSVRFGQGKASSSSKVKK